MDDRYIYLDNAATSHFKPKEVYTALNYDITNSANSGRSGHRYAMDAAMRIENARSFLLSKLGGEEDYALIFTKNCTEALNLAIFGYVEKGMRVIADGNAHNSILRPLFELKRQGIIDLFIVNQLPDGSISPEHVIRAAENADLVVLTSVSNVTGASIDVGKVGEFTRERGIKLLVDGAQAVPVFDLNLKRDRIDMLALPGHKGLHGIQGTGFLALTRTISLKPLIYGGTGTASNSVFQPFDYPEGYESGTQFSGGISALHAGTRWTYDNLVRYRLNLKKQGEEIVHYLKALGVTVYTKDCTAGVISFNIEGYDSGFVADKLNDKGIAVRSGLHCAPLVHEFLGTTACGAVRVSLGIDNTEKHVYTLITALEDIIANGR